MSSNNLLRAPVVDKSTSLDVIFGFLHLAQRRGAFSFPESAKIYNCIQQFNDFFEPPPEEEKKEEEEELGEFDDDDKVEKDD
jgi:hypothetical protein